jgi:hypothetical protein
LHVLVQVSPLRATQRLLRAVVATKESELGELRTVAQQPWQTTVLHCHVRSKFFPAWLGLGHPPPPN